MTFLREFVRGLRARKTLSLINVLSLAVGLRVFSLAFQNVERELSYGRAWPDAEGIYRLVLETQGVPGLADGASDIVSARDYSALQDYFSEELRHASRVASYSVRPEGQDSGTVRLSLVDPGFLGIFKADVLAGSLEQVLQTPKMIALSEARALALWCWKRCECSWKWLEAAVVIY